MEAMRAQTRTDFDPSRLRAVFPKMEQRHRVANQRSEKAELLRKAAAPVIYTSPETTYYKVERLYIL
eukprot:SAG31_NODE_3010_length_4788_cov_4.266098_3_plen_67_part_00